MSSPLKNNTDKIQNILDLINNLPDSDGSADGSQLDAFIDGSLTEVTTNALTFRADAFYAHPTITSIYAPFATTIPNRMFYGNYLLVSANLPSVTYIGQNLFNSCIRLASVNVPLATDVQNNAFYDCQALKNIDLPKVEKIGAYAFYWCRVLSALILRSNQVCNLTAANALTGTPIASGTGYIYVPSALIEEYKAASNWSTYAAQFRALEDYTVDGTVTGEVDTTRCRVRFLNEDGTLLGYVMVPNGGSATYTGDEPTKEDGSEFTGWSPEPANVTSDMDCYAQFASTELVYRKLIKRELDGEYTNNRVDKIGRYAFYKCIELNRVDLPSATYVDTGAFEYCTKLSTLILRSTTGVATLYAKSSLRDTPIASGSGYIYVPSALVDSYKAATNWSNYGNQFRAIEDYPDICGGE